MKLICLNHWEHIKKYQKNTKNRDLYCWSIQFQVSLHVNFYHSNWTKEKSMMISAANGMLSILPVVVIFLSLPPDAQILPKGVEAGGCCLWGWLTEVPIWHVAVPNAAQRSNSKKSRMPRGWLIISGENILRFPMVMAEPLVDPAFDVFGPSPQRGHLIGQCDPPRR